MLTVHMLNTECISLGSCAAARLLSNCECVQCQRTNRTHTHKLQHYTPPRIRRFQSGAKRMRSLHSRQRCRIQYPSHDTQRFLELWQYSNIRSRRITRQPAEAAQVYIQSIRRADYYLWQSLRGFIGPDGNANVLG